MDFRDRGSDLGIEMVEFRTTVPVEWNAYAADAVKIGHRVADVPRTASMKGGEYSPPNATATRSAPATATGFNEGRGIFPAKPPDVVAECRVVDWLQ